VPGNQRCQLGNAAQSHCARSVLSKEVMMSRAG
jgi:hypothetical protein